MTPLLLLFDMDGTLLDTRADLAAAVNAMRLLHDLPPLSLKTITTFVGDGILKLSQRALKGTDVDPEKAIEEIEEAYAGLLTNETRPYPGVDEGLRTLHATGHRLAVITNKPGRHARALCAHFGWTHLFIRILGGGDTKALKPSPVPLEQIMRQAETGPDRTWMIGDHYTDIEAAHAAGVHSVFLENGIGAPRQNPPEWICPDFTDFVRRILDAAGTLP